MKVLCAMSGGVDSSVAAARLREDGHEVVGVTMKLWGGESDTGCCSVSDVDDARRVAQQLGIVHHTWTFTDDFEQRVVEPYVDAHRRGHTPNPCIECNRHLKFDRLLERALAVGFDAVATGHHARIVTHADDGTFRLARGADQAKDQSYVLYVLGQEQLSRTLLPVGDLTKDEVRAEADRLGLRTASKPDSQDVCFITSTSGRVGFLGKRLDFHPAPVVDADGKQLATVEAVELVTVGQRRGLGLPGGGESRYVVDVDVPRRRVRVGSVEELDVTEVRLGQLVWADRPYEGPVLAQCSAHGAPRPARLELASTPDLSDLSDLDGSSATADGGAESAHAVPPAAAVVRFDEPQRRVATGQSVVLYVGDEVVGGGTVAAPISTSPGPAEEPG